MQLTQLYPVMPAAPCSCVHRFDLLALARVPGANGASEQHSERAFACRWLSDRIKVLIYSGDVDSCVPTLGTESYFLRTLDLTVSQRWAPWKCENEDGHYARAGYYEKFGGTKHGIDFVTFNGAGHMVPQYKPVEALALMKRWLEGSSMRGNFQPSIKAASAAVADMIANEDPDAQTLWRRPS